MFGNGRTTLMCFLLEKKGGLKWEIGNRFYQFFVSVAMVLTILTSLCWAADRQDIVIGIINPFSGPAADFGASAREGAEEAVAVLNSTGVFWVGS